MLRILQRGLVWVNLLSLSGRHLGRVEQHGADQGREVGFFVVLELPTGQVVVVVVNLNLPSHPRVERESETRVSLRPKSVL